MGILAYAMEEYTCFDYKAQEWTSGERARLLIIEQTKIRLTLLRRPDAAEYVGGCHNWRTHPQGPPTVEYVIAQNERVLAAHERAEVGSA